MSVIDVLSQVLGDYRETSGNEHVFYCPFCLDVVGETDTTGHLYVNPDVGFFCHRCLSKGSVKRLLHLLGISKDDLAGLTPEAPSIRAYFSVGWDETSTPDSLASTVLLPKDIYPVASVPDVHAYAISRGLTDYYCITHNIYAWLDGQEQWRLLFADYYEGALVFWQARTIGTRRPKYLSAFGADKSKCVWNLERVNPEYPIYVAEGILSAIACGRNGVAIYGKYVSEVQLFLIASRCGEQGVRIVLDSDARANSFKALDLFLGINIPTGVVIMPEGSDPDSMDEEVLADMLLSCSLVTSEESPLEYLRHANI